jgi:hypothetical protein
MIALTLATFAGIGGAHAAGEKTIALVPGIATDAFYITMQ